MSALRTETCRFFIRRMRESDLPGVLEIERVSFSNPWSADTFKGEIQNESISFPMVVVEQPGEKVVAYVIYWRIHDDVQINNVAVHPDYRRLGIGETMLRNIIEKLKKAGVSLISLDVRLSNSAAISFYKKLGFEVLGTRKGYYTCPDEDAYVMGLLL